MSTTDYVAVSISDILCNLMIVYKLTNVKEEMRITGGLLSFSKLCFRNIIAYYGLHPEMFLNINNSSASVNSK